MHILLKLKFRFGVRIYKSISYRVRPPVRSILFFALRLRNKAAYTLFVKKPRVTISGSCRQDAIYSNFNVTPIRNGLTYPHYSKEIIQAIKYCKDPNFQIPSWAFRNSQIGIKLDLQKSLHRHFERTNIFIVEIASLIEYTHNGVFLHHELYDNPILNSEEGWPSKDQVSVREQTTEELHRDLNEIVELLEGKKVIFACPFSTRSTGKRAQIISTILDFCEGKKIPVFLPTDMLEFYGESEIFVQEQVLSHFTELGHRIAGYRYRELIESEFSNQISILQPLIQTLTPPKKGSAEFPPGFGDYLNGSIKVFATAKKIRRLPKVDFSSTLFSNHLRCRYRESVFTKVDEIYHEDSDVQFFKSHRVFTNKVEEGPVSEEAKDFIFRNCLSQKPSLTLKIQKAKESLQLGQAPYIVLHIRVSDDFDESLDAGTLARIEDLVEELSAQEEKEMILISNSTLIRQHFARNGIKSPFENVRHSSDVNANSNSIEQTLVEFFLLSSASRIYQISTYGWGSSFSLLASRLYDVPLERIGIAR